jgi:protein involved in polysaccharide export with SLBB domain
MQVRQGRWVWQAVAGAVLALTAGCANHLDRALLADHNPAAHRPDARSEYCVHCPDVLEVAVPGWSGEQPVGPDGRVRPAGSLGVRVEGLTPAEASRQIARELGVNPASVKVRVVGFNSQTIYVHGEVMGLQRAVDYEGPETVVDLLQRLGGIAPGAATGEIQIVRSRVADGRAPEVFHVDLEAILQRGDQSTNIHLEPFDQLYIGQTRQHCIACCLPPWMRSLFSQTPIDATGNLPSYNPVPAEKRTAH